MSGGDERGTGTTARTPALAGLLRLLGHPDLASRAADDLQRLVDERFDRLLDGLVAETAASDDVHDRQSASDYLEARLRDLEPFLTPGQSARLRAAALERIAGW